MVDQGRLAYDGDLASERDLALCAQGERTFVAHRLSVLPPAARP